MNPNLTGSTDKPRAFDHFLRVIRERWRVVILAVVVAGVLAFGASLLLPSKYRATAEVSYSQDDAQRASQALSSAGTAAAPHNVANDALALKTTAFAEAVAKAMGGSVAAETLRSSVQAVADTTTDLIEILASASDPVEAASIANAFASEFVKERQDRAAQSLAEAQKLFKDRIDKMTEAEAASAYGIALKQRYDDLTMLASLQVKDYTILQKATAPTSAYYPRKWLGVLIGLAVGLILGLLAALILDRRDKSVKDQTMLERLMDLPILGAIPAIDKKKGHPAQSGAGVGFTAGNDPLLEAMRMLRSNLKVLGFGESNRSILVTSVGPGEGKSELAVNLALSMALAGDRVVLVDADFRNPMIHDYLHIPNSEGLADVLIDRNAPWSAKLKAVELSRFVAPEVSEATPAADGGAPITKFLCMTSGPLMPNPSEVLESGAIVEVLADLQGISDYVIVDGPPMLVASDSLTMAQAVDALVLSSMLGRDTDSELVEVREMLARAEISPLGIVMCGVKHQSREAYSGHHPHQEEAGRYPKD